MSYNWKQNPDLSSKSDADYTNDIISSISDHIRVNQNDMASYLQRANAYLDLGKYEDAAQDYSTIIKADSENTVALNNRGICYRSLGMPDQAILDFTSAIFIASDGFQAVDIHRFTKLKALFVSKSLAA